MNYCFFYSGAQDYEALLLYIANNLEWMSEWIETCKSLNDGRLSWQPLFELIREVYRSGDGNVTDREIDLAYGLKDRKVSN